MHRELLEWEWIRTKVMSHHALSRNGVSAQLMNTKYVTHITKQDEKPPIACMTFYSKPF